MLTKFVVMITADEVREKLSGELNRLDQYHVSKLWLFGSAARSEGVVHDLDFLVEYKTPPGLLDFMELKFFLEEMFGLSVDLHSSASCPDRFYQRIKNDLKHVA